jgi:hypothetical protein
MKTGHDEKCMPYQETFVHVVRNLHVPSYKIVDMLQTLKIVY